MAAWTLPFVHKSDDSGFALVMLGAVVLAFGYVAWRLWRHHSANHAARKSGINRRHDGRHGNH